MCAEVSRDLHSLFCKTHGDSAYSRENGAGVKMGGWLRTTAIWIGIGYEERWEVGVSSKLVAELLSK